MIFRRILLVVFASLLTLFSIGVQQHLHAHENRELHNHWFVGGIAKAGLQHHLLCQNAPSSADSDNVVSCEQHTVNEFSLEDPAVSQKSSHRLLGAADLPLSLARSFQERPSVDSPHPAAIARPIPSQRPYYLRFQVFRL